MYDTSEDALDCTAEQILQATSITFYTGMLYVNPSDVPSITGKSGLEIEERYKQMFNNSLPYGAYHRLQTYDSIVAIAMALNESNKRLIESGLDKFYQ